MSELRPDPDTQPALREESVFIPGVGNATVATSGDLGPSFDAKECVRSLFDEQGNFAPTTQLGAHAKEVTNREYVVREQLARGNTQALTEEVRSYEREIATVKGLGLAVVPHISVILPVSNPTTPNQTTQEPSILTIAPKIPGQQNYDSNFNPHNPDNIPTATKITRVLQKYYTGDRERSHLSDIYDPSQYSSEGVLLDLDMTTTQAVQWGIDEDHETCERQLTEMYDKFDLSDEQIASLQRDHSTDNRPSGGESMSASLQQIYAQFEAVEARTEEALKLLRVAFEFAKEAEDAIRSTGEWIGREQDVIVQTAHYWEGTRTGIDNLTEMFHVAVERMWKSFPKI